MYLVKTYVAPSSLSGLGVFAGEDIKEGTRVWELDERIDQVYSQADLESFPEHVQDFLQQHAYLSTKITDKWVLAGDQAQYTNHSKTHQNLASIPADDSQELVVVAMRDIKKGEELLVDYQSFDVNDAESDESYLQS